MEIKINIEDSQLNELINKTTTELGQEYFTDIMKAAFESYIKKELECAFACLAGQYHTADKNTDTTNKNTATSIIRSLFVKEIKSNNSYSFSSNSVTYQPTEYLSNLINTLDVKEEMLKYRDELMATLHETIDGHILSLMKSMFIGNILTDNTFQYAIQNQMSFAFNNIFQKHMQESHQPR